MKKLILLISILLATFIIGACEESEEDKIKRDPLPSDEIKDDDEIAAVGNLHGRAEKGPYLKDTDVTAAPYGNDWDQSGFPKEGSTEKDDGSYQIYSPVSSEFVRMRIEGESYNEVDDVYDHVSLRDISRNDSSAKNLNPLTHVLDMVAFDYCRDPNHAYYHQGDYCISLAQSEILSYLGFIDHGVDLNKMSLQGNTISDAQMAVFSFYIAGGRTGPEQNDYMREVANGVLDNDLVLKQNIQDVFATMKFVNTRKNLRSKYASMGLGEIFPPVELLPFVPWYYADLWGRTPALLDSKNTEYASLGALDTDNYRFFAYPVVFQNAEQMQYLPLNLPNATSIWSVMICPDGYHCPASKVADLTVMNEALIDEPVRLQYNYFITGSLSSNVQYFVRQEFEENTAPRKVVQGDMVPFGKNIFSVDGVIWLGGGILTPGWSNRSIKYTGHD